MKELIFNPQKINLISILFTIFIFGTQIFLYKIIAPQSSIKFSLPTVGIISIAFAFGTIIHELIHGICFARYAKKGFKAIRFGIIWKHLVFYCHCNESLKINQYRIVLLMPAITLGVLPTIIGYIIQSLPLLFWSNLMLVAATTDFICFWALQTFDNTTIIQDHPTKIGFYYTTTENL